MWRSIFAVVISLMFFQMLTSWTIPISEMEMSKIVVDSTTYSRLDTVICTGDTVYGYTQSGTYLDTFTNVFGGDSIRTIDLIVQQLMDTLVYDTVCIGSNPYPYDSAGLYVDTLQTVFGCDSIRKLDLTVLPAPKDTTIYRFMCRGGSFEKYTSPGTYVDTFRSVSGCDSIRELRLFLVFGSLQVTTDTICEGQQRNGHTTTGIYRDTFFSKLTGCDSLIEALALEVKPRVRTYVDTAMCEGEFYRGVGSSGTYQFILPAEEGCDTLLEVRLTVLPYDYPQCSPTATDEFDRSQLQLYPNPTNSFLYFENIRAVRSVEIFDKLGRSMLVSHKEHNQLDVSTLPTGVYRIKFTTDHGVYVDQFVKLN